MAVLCVQLFRLGTRDGDSGSAAETVCKQRSREWAVLRSLRYYGNRDACCLPGTAWNLAVSRQYDLFDPGGVDRWPCDREDVP